MRKSCTQRSRWLTRSALRAHLPALLLVASFAFSFSARAQLSGTYTIGPSGNYTTLSDAVSDLTGNGISGPVTFQVAAGTYNESIDISYISGASAANTVTFQGAGRGKSNISSSNETVIFDGCSYVTFRGFTISASGFDAAVHGASCFKCAVLNSDITVGSNSNEAINDDYTDSFTVMNCHISGGGEGVYINGGGSSSYSGALYQNNRIVNFNYTGISSYGAWGNTYRGNVFDSAVYTWGSCVNGGDESGALYENNIMVAKSGNGFDMYDMNYYSSTVPFRVINNVVVNTQYDNYFSFYSAGNVVIAHNTMVSANDYALYIDADYATSGVVIADNILYTGSGQAAMYLYEYGTTFPAPFTMIDGNDLYNAGGGALYMSYTGSTATYNTLADYKTAMSAYTYTNPYNGSKGIFGQFASSMAPTFVNPSANNYHLNQKVLQPSGVYAGIDKDIDGDARCLLFPTAGVDESNYGKGKPTVQIYLPGKIYPGSPTYVNQSGKAGEPKMYFWYLNGVLVSDSVILKTSSFVSGTNTLKLVTKTCAGNDSDTKTFSVAAPTAVPGTDFIADNNTIESGAVVNFQDLSSNGPTSWKWQITPDSALVSGVKVPTVKYVFGSDGYQNPSVRFLEGGKYTVCLTASNGLGNGSKDCKTNYINVLPSINMSSSMQTIHNAEGYLYDNGGPNGNYNYEPNNNNVESILIDPCADSVYLVLSQFDMNCGEDFLRIYAGSDNTGTPLWNVKCSGNGYNNEGPGYTGGKAGSCSYQCMPNLGDTFKAAGKMYIEMVSADAWNSAGFAAHWWSKPKKSNKPTASFITSNAGDSVCTNASLTFTNTSKYDPSDVPTYLWDLDGDLTTFECVGSCQTAAYPYFLNGPVITTLIATNCGGSDTFSRKVTVYNPKSPVALFSADNTNPTTNDVVFFTSNVKECVDNYKWTITPSAGTSGTVSYVNGTSDASDNPQVTFSNTGFYDVKFYVENASGVQKDSVIKTKYIEVRNPYCIPSVGKLNSGIGISKVVLNTIDSKQGKVSQDYYNFTADQSLSTSLAIGATYTLSISRDSNAVFEPENRTAYIDWNDNGVFESNEIIASDSNSFSNTFTKRITVPKTATVGATVMRIAVNRGTYTNKPCGQNEFGEYQDYRIYVTPYNIAPVITLKGHKGLKDTIVLEQGNAFTEAGYSASSFLYGDVTKDVVRTSRKLNSNNPADSFNAYIPAIYIFSYNVTDSVGNKAVTQMRIVKVTPDKTAPALIVAGPDTTLIEVTKTPMHPVPVPAVISADDKVDGPLAGSVIIDSSKVQTNIVGTYVVSYVVSDLSNNTATIYRVVKVIDTIKPVITLIGAQADTIDVYSSYIDGGVNISDNYYQAVDLLPLLSSTSTVDTSKTGVYTVTYMLSDPSHNVAVPVVRTVVVVDRTAPVISLNGLPADSIEVNSDYNDPYVTVSDNYNKLADIAVSVTGTFYTNFPGGKNANKTGTYTIIYTATDKSGNKASVTRIVKVQDRIAPVITLIGQNTVTVCRWFNYQDAGYTVTDNYNKATDIKVDTITTGNTQRSNLFTVRYKATDLSGNVGYSEYRYVMVKGASEPECASGIEPGLGLDKYISVYPNPNAGIFTINANLPNAQNVHISITNVLGQELQVVQNGVMQQNNITVDLSNQPAGMYMVNITTANQTMIQKIEITK